MSPTTQDLLARLQKLLPLVERQAALAPSLRQLHRQFLRSLVRDGRLLTTGEMAPLAPDGDVESALRVLTAADLLVCGDEGQPVGAYPVTTAPTPYRIAIDDHRLYAMCALDAVSVAPIFGLTVRTESRCPLTGVPIELQQRGQQIERVSPDDKIQIGIWWRDPGAVAARNLCSGIVFLRHPDAALAWQAGSAEARSTIGLVEATELGSRFFHPLVGEEAMTRSRTPISTARP